MAELVTGSAAAAAAAKKKKKKGMTVNLDVFLAAGPGASGATPEPRADSDDELPIRQENRQQGRRRRQDVQLVPEAAAFEAPVHVPAPAAPRAYDFPSLELASELTARKGMEAEPVRDYVMEALSSLKLCELGVVLVTSMGVHVRFAGITWYTKESAANLLAP